MKITLLKGFDDSYRQSMTLYEECLMSALRPGLQPEDTLTSVSPFPALLSPRVVRYFSQYALYPLETFWRQGDVNHITDHSYAHLLYSLEPSKTMVTFHDAIWLKTRRAHFDSQSGEKMRWIRAFNLKALEKAARIICDSEASRKALLHYLDYPLTKIEVIAPGLPESFLKRIDGPALQVPGLGDGPFILHVGHTQAYKNIPALFHALAELKKLGSRVRLVKVGTPFSAEQEKTAQDLGVWDRVTHLGKVAPETLPSIYKAADMLLQPSFDEGFGFPVLEAMACGLPVIASNRGSLPELVKDAGVLVEAEDFYGMAKAAEKILNEPEFRAQLAQKGKTRAALYSWKKAAGQILEVYRCVYNETRKGV